MTRRLPIDWIVLASAVGLVLLAVPACGTREIGTDQVVQVTGQADPSQGELLITVAPAPATYAEAQAATGPSAKNPRYHLLIDGKELMYPDPVEPVTVGGGGAYGAGFHAAGLHHFTFVSLDDPTVFAADGMIVSGALTRLYVFGPPDSLQARFVVNPFVSPPGQQHLGAINLVRAEGVQIELLSCSDATTCTPLSPPLALGDTFDADVPANDGSAGTSLSGSGAGYGYRQVATASAPNPPILAMWPADSGNPELGGSPTFIAAPIYLGADGSLLQSAL
jgi:hypothetical protein